jgi:hypothetical protein
LMPADVEAALQAVQELTRTERGPGDRIGRINVSA